MFPNFIENYRKPSYCDTQIQADTPDVDGDRCFWACRKKYSQRDISYGNKLISGSRGFHWQTEAVQPTKKELYQT